VQDFEGKQPFNHKSRNGRYRLDRSRVNAWPRDDRRHGHHRLSARVSRRHRTIARLLGLRQGYARHLPYDNRVIQGAEFGSVPGTLAALLTKARTNFYEEIFRLIGKFPHKPGAYWGAGSARSRSRESRGAQLDEVAKEGPVLQSHQCFYRVRGALDAIRAYGQQPLVYNPELDPQPMASPLGSGESFSTEYVDVGRRRTPEARYAKPRILEKRCPDLLRKILIESMNIRSRSRSDCGSLSRSRPGNRWTARAYGSAPRYTPAHLNG